MNLLNFSLLFVLMATTLCCNIIFHWPDTRLRLIQCNVGQGDAILLTRGFSQILIDTGPDTTVGRCLTRYIPFWDRHLDLVVVTHPDSDHSGGMETALQYYSVGRIVTNRKTTEVEGSGQGRQPILSQQPQTKDISGFSGIEINQIIISFLHPESDKLSNSGSLTEGLGEQNTEVSAKDVDNTNSLVSRVVFRDFSALLMADVPVSVEQKLMKQYVLKTVLLKIGHHGSRSSTSKQLLQEVEPQIATIGVGRNTYGHPAPQVLGFLADLRIPTYRTDQDGDIVVTTDGKTWTVQTEKGDIK